MNRDQVIATELGLPTVESGNRGEKGVIASWTYCPEAREEEDRVTSAGRYRLPGVWITPAPERNSAWRGVAGVPRKPRCAPMPGATRTAEPSSEKPAELALFFKVTDIAETIAELLERDHAQAWVIYQMAWKRHQRRVQYGLIKAMKLVGEDTKFRLRMSVPSFPKTWVTARLLRALKRPAA